MIGGVRSRGDIHIVLQRSLATSTNLERVDLVTVAVLGAHPPLRIVDTGRGLRPIV